MADNVDVTPGTGATIATDDVGGVQFQRVKMDIGGDGVSSPVTSGNPIPVAATQSGPWSMATDYTFADDIASSSGNSVAAIGLVRDDVLSTLTPIDGDYTFGRVDSQGALWVHAVGGAAGTEYTEDAVAAANPSGPMMMAIRDDGPLGALTDADGDNIALRANQYGALKVNLDILGALDGGSSSNPIYVEFAGGTSTVVRGAVTHDANATGTNPVLVGGYASAAAPASVSTDGDAVRAWYLRNGAQATVLTAAGALIGGDATNGIDVDVTRLPGQITDNGGFTDGTTAVLMAGYIFDETAGTALTENDAAAARVDSKRAQVQVLEDATTRGQRQAVDASGNAAVADKPTTAGGLTLTKTVSAASTNATSVKASAGQVYTIFASNANAAIRYLKLYNKASAPTVGTDVPVWTLAIPAGGILQLNIDKGLAFATGIAFALTTDATDAGTTGVALSEIVVNLGYK